MTVFIRTHSVSIIIEHFMTHRHKWTWYLLNYQNASICEPLIMVVGTKILHWEYFDNFRIFKFSYQLSNKRLRMLCGRKFLIFGKDLYRLEIDYCNFHFTLWWSYPHLRYWNKLKYSLPYSLFRMMTIKLFYFCEQYLQLITCAPIHSLFIKSL